MTPETCLTAQQVSDHNTLISIALLAMFVALVAVLWQVGDDIEQWLKERHDRHKRP